MKRCPTCNKTFTDPVLSFCLDDGTPLVQDDDPTVGSNERSEDWNAVTYRPPGGYVPPGGSSNRKVWPWILGIVSFVVLGIAGLGIAAAVFFPRLVRSEQSRQQRDDRVPGPANANTNTAPGDDTNANANLSDAPNTPAPTDKDKVLADLTALEHDWTAANLNADKKALDRILADDYAGAGEGGEIQGKAEYIREIKPDRTVEKWDFEKLQVNLRGDRAILSGKIRLIVSGKEVVLEFTDKFVWRGGRWQATGSEVSRSDDNANGVL